MSDTSSDSPTGNTSIADTLQTILRGFLNDDQHELNDSTLISSLGLESVVVLEFVTDVEDHFDINIDLDSLANIQTLSDLAEAVTAQGVESS